MNYLDTYRENFIEKWKEIFIKSEDKNKTFYLNYEDFIKDLEPLFEDAIISYFSERTKNFVDIKELPYGL